MKVNYIKQLEAVTLRMSDDTRLNSSHVSMYLALFLIWNHHRFQNPLSINRSEVMKVSKIGSANTYTRCLKQLDEWGYIQYLPSFNPLRGSLVNLYTFDNSSDKGTDKASGKASDYSSVIAVRPSINNLNNRNNKTDKPLKGVKGKFTKPSIQEVIDFFSEKKHDQVDAEKFFNHFESNGWLVSGKTPMKNWQAAARNWMINSEKFNSSSNSTGSLSQSKGAGHLNVNQNKDYSVPL